MHHLKTLLLTALVYPNAWACSLQIAYSDVAAPPYLVGDGQVVPAAPGIAIDLVQEAATAIGCTVQWQRMPNRRVQREMESGNLDAMLMYSFNTERAAYAVYPMKDGNPDGTLRLAELRYHIYVQGSSTLAWDGKQFTPTPAPVGVNFGYSVAGDLKKLGLQVEEARSTEQNLQKLQSARIAAYVMQDMPADALIDMLGIQDVRKLPVPFSAKDYFLPFSRNFYAKSPDLAARLWEQIAKTRKSQINTLLKKYNDTL